MKLAATMLLHPPIPKIVGQSCELGYDISIDENGRTGEKLIKWDYQKDPDRASLFAHYAKLIHWKRHNRVFRNGTANHQVNAALKYYRLQDDEQEVLVVGNFD